MPRRVLVLALGLLLAAACPGDGSPALRVVVLSAGALEVTQLSVSAVLPDGTVLGPQVRPEAEGELLGERELVRLLFAPEHAGSEIELRVEGLKGGAVRARGQGRARLLAGAEGEVEIGLGAGCPAPCAEGQRCVDGACRCTAASCPEGCCDGETCRVGQAEACGHSGGACSPCPAASSDSCVAGECRCGGGPACVPGQDCLNGVCRCTPTSCPNGCCQGEVCQSGKVPEACGSAGVTCSACPLGESCDGGRCSGCAKSCTGGCCAGALCTATSIDSCGTGGVACVACPAGRSDGCSAAGECECGSGAPCEPGQRCVLGACVCDDDSCPTGCCESNRCQARSVATCGAHGATCVGCGMGADNCGADGICHCGPGAVCQAGTRCITGVCQCDALSCPEGCCTDAGCVVPSAATCGISGAACLACDARADGCDRGECKCGGGWACGPGQRCLGGRCECDPATCAGCCSGADCLAGDLPTACGTGGAACAVCDTSTADGCSGGACTCGAVTACQGGSRCEGAACACDPASCPSGCCAPTGCMTPSHAACGLPGGTCVACHPNKTDSCTAGECTCGGGPACPETQRCQEGRCVCDPESCPGCCAGDLCLPGASPAQCGLSGSICQACDLAADTCAGGACRCGAGPACGAGQRCVAGRCVCDAGSCAGCCAGDVCLPGSDKNACGGGGAACVKCPGAAQCSAGQCS